MPLRPDLLRKSYTGGGACCGGPTIREPRLTMPAFDGQGNPAELAGRLAVSQLDFDIR